MHPKYGKGPCSRSQISQPDSHDQAIKTPDDTGPWAFWGYKYRQNPSFYANDFWKVREN